MLLLPRVMGVCEEAPAAMISAAKNKYILLMIDYF
jgi:hypothetical protein